MSNEPPSLEEVIRVTREAHASDKRLSCYGYDTLLDDNMVMFRFDLVKAVAKQLPETTPLLVRDALVSLMREDRRKQDGGRKSII